MNGVHGNTLNSMFSEISIAYWFMDDGYYDNNKKTMYFCTENFTKEECIFLIDLLSVYGLKTTLSLRNKVKDTYRIRISFESKPLFRPWTEFTAQFSSVHSCFMYKLGL